MQEKISLKLHKRSPSIRDENAINAIFVNNERRSIPNKFVNIEKKYFYLLKIEDGKNYKKLFHC